MRSMRCTCRSGRPIQLTMISQDVFHSFSIPAFRIKREVIPGRYSTVWFEATTPGTYHLFCTQYCGTQPLADDRRSDGDDAGRLQEVDRRSRPAACRWRRTASGCLPAWAATPATRATPRRAGPAWPASTGRSCTLTDGSQVLVNDAYLRDAILNPSEHVTAGYAPIMPTYQGQISEDGLIDLVEYHQEPAIPTTACSRR